MKIVFLDTATLNFDGMDISILQELGVYSAYERTPPEKVEERIKGAEVIISNKVLISKDHISGNPSLKYIVVAATGYNNIDVKAARQNDVMVSNVRGYSTEGVVQHTFSLIMTLLNKVAYYDLQVKAGRWENADDFCFYDHSILELAGKTMGIYGYGNIGKRVAQVSSAFGMKVIGYARNKDKIIHSEHTLVSEETLLEKSDILTLHAPLNDDSFEFINKVRLAKMKKSALLINTGRGHLVHEKDLADALINGKIAGAGLDTLGEEPPSSGSPLISLTNCIVTPHIAWGSLESRQRLLNGIFENIKSYQNNKPFNLVN